MVLNFILQHKDDDVRSLALKGIPEGMDAQWVLQQIEGYQLAKKKLPTWAEKIGEGIEFPPRISMEQCSSELTAKYKKSILERLGIKREHTTLIDLNGGLGVDFSYMAQGFGRAIYVEQNERLCRIAKKNMPILGIDGAYIYNKRCEDFIKDADAIEKPAVIYLDPARRDTNGRKVVTIEDCTPNITQLQDKLREIADYVMVKLSPMLDITEALRKLSGVREIHVVSLNGECKELLLVMSKDTEGSNNGVNVEIRCVNLGTEDDDFAGSMSQTPSYFTQYEEIFYKKDNKTERYLFEPNASIMKAGVQDAFGNHYDLRKLHPMSNLYVGNNKIDHVPARQFRIVSVTDFSKEGLKKMLRDMKKANLTIRNFPSDVATLRKRLKIKEGGSDYLFATTLYDGSHVLLHCVKD